MTASEKKTILVVEDDQSMQRSLIDILGFEGFDVIGADNGEVALQVALTQSPDLILSDIRMPIMDGFELFEAIRSHPKLGTTPFIFVSAFASPENLARAERYGADGFLVKPIDFPSLFGAILSAFKKREQVKEGLDIDLEVNVFLSYSRNDTEVMKRVHDSLIANKLKVWTDEDLDLGTADWEHSIVNILKNAGCVAVILSPDAERSKWVGRELAMAETLNLRIFPILARGDERNAIPIRLISHQRVDIRHNYDTGIEKLVLSIRKHLKLNS